MLASLGTFYSFPFLLRLVLGCASILGASSCPTFRRKQSRIRHERQRGQGNYTRDSELANGPSGVAHNCASFRRRSSSTNTRLSQPPTDLQPATSLKLPLGDLIRRGIVHRMQISCQTNLRRKPELGNLHTVLNLCTDDFHILQTSLFYTNLPQSVTTISLSSPIYDLTPAFDIFLLVVFILGHLIFSVLRFRKVEAPTFVF